MDENKKYQIIRKAYKGEETRDASSTIRGFLFQDLIAIQKLIDPSTVAVCSEYIEDVTVFRNDVTYIIQAKYYPGGGVAKEEIMRELYYQYLRLQLLEYEKVKPILALYSPHKMRKPSKEKMWDYVKVTERDEIPTERPKDIEKWLEENVYSKTKEVAEDIFFDKFVTNTTIKEFLDNLEIDQSYQEIGAYRKNVADTLNQISFPGCTISDKEHRTSILLGLAVQYIQEKYNEKIQEADILEVVLCPREQFVAYLRENLCVETDERIGAFLEIVVLDTWEKILKRNTEMTEEQKILLECIQENTAVWITKLVCKDEGRLQLLNTVSGIAADELNGYVGKSIGEQYGIIREHREKIEDFLKYLWKIMININQDILHQQSIEEQRERLKPQHYINPCEKRYISFKFPKESAESVAIVSPAVRPNATGTLTNVFSRMREVQPNKWYMCGEYHGIYKYDMDVSQIKEEHMVSALEENTFRIECMDCIPIDDGCWSQTEMCEETIFTNICTKRENEK